MRGADKSYPSRKPIRLKEYDYSLPGTFFITICTADWKCLFGKIKNGKMLPNWTGNMVQTVWDELSIRYHGVMTDVFILMPNHIHGIIIAIDDPVGAGPRAGPVGRADCQMGELHVLRRVSPPGQPQGIVSPDRISLPNVVQWFKSLTTHRFRKRVFEITGKSVSPKFWQRSYFDRIIRNEKELGRVRKYILDNPIQWELDHDNPNAKINNTVPNPWEEF